MTGLKNKKEKKEQQKKPKSEVLCHFLLLFYGAVD